MEYNSGRTIFRFDSSSSVFLSGNYESNSIYSYLAYQRCICNGNGRWMHGVKKCIVQLYLLEKPALVIKQKTAFSEAHCCSLIIYRVGKLYILIASRSQNTLVFLMWTMFETSENNYFFKGWTILSSRLIAINWISAAKINNVIQWILISAFYQS